MVSLCMSCKHENKQITKKLSGAKIVRLIYYDELDDKPVVKVFFPFSSKSLPFLELSAGRSRNEWHFL